MSNQQAILDVVQDVAQAWIDPEYSPRVEAEKQLLSSSMRATPEAVAFAINQQMPQLSASGLSGWVPWRESLVDKEIGVIQKARTPLDDLGTWLSIVLSGGEYVGLYEEGIDPVFTAFVEDICNRDSSIRTSMQDIQSEWSDLDGLIGLGCPTDIIEDRLEGVINKPAVLSRPVKYNVAVIDGKESRDEREDLAEDVLMHEAMGEMSVRIIWAPEELNPDPYFEAFAFFRGVYPAHERTPGSLQMRKAFLAAEGSPHAYGDGLEFLISRGEPDYQEPCHVRWVTYKGVDDVKQWLEENTKDIHYLVARTALQTRIHTEVPQIEPGKVHRIALKEQLDQLQIRSFLDTL